MVGRMLVLGEAHLRQMSSASVNTGARDHARSQLRTATMRIPASPPDVDPSRLLWAETVPPGSYATRVLGRGTRLSADRSRRRRVRPPAALPRGRAVRAAQRRRHREGAVAGIPRTRPSAAVRSGPGAGDRGRGPLRPPRHVVRHDRRRASKDAVGRRRARPRHPRRRAVGVVVQGRPLRRRRHARFHRFGRAWRAGNQLAAPVNDDPGYLRALFNTESTWAAAQTSEACTAFGRMRRGARGTSSSSGASTVSMTWHRCTTSCSTHSIGPRPR